MITIDCDTQAGQTINVVTGDIITVTGTYLELPEWFLNNVGSVPSVGAWNIILEDESVITIATPKYRLNYSTGGYVDVYREKCPQTVNLREGKWNINDVAYEGTYSINSNVDAVKVV